MTNQDLTKIREMAQRHRETPKPQAWERVSSQLGHQATTKRLSFYRRMSVAAVMVALVCVTVLVSQQLKQQKVDTLVANDANESLIITELTDTKVLALYNVDDVNGLYRALQKVRK